MWKSLFARPAPALAAPPPRPEPATTAQDYERALVAQIYDRDPRMREAHRRIVAAVEAINDPASRQHQMTHALRWLQTVAMLPEGPGELVDIAAAPFYADAVRAVKGLSIAEVATLAIDYEKDPLPFAAERFDAALLGEVIEHFVLDPLYALIEINRVLKPGGVLVVTTPNIASWFAIHQALNQRHPSRWPVYARDPAHARNHLHAREYTVAELRAVVEAAGFEIGRALTMDYAIAPPFTPIPGFAPEDRGETIYLAARKTGRPRFRALAPLYLENEPFTGYGA